MPIDIDKILLGYAAGLSRELIDNIKNKLLERKGARGRFESVANASGKLAESVRSEVKGGELTIYASDYIYYLENGRQPGKPPPRDVIKQWILDKGIIPEDITIDSLAYLIQRRIAEEGTTIYQANGSDILSSIFDIELVNSLQDEFAGLVAIEIIDEFNAINKAA